MQSSSTVTPPKAQVAHTHTPMHGEDKAEHSHSHGPLRAVIIGLAALLLALLALAFGYGAAHNGQVFRGVSVLGKDLGGMSLADARAALAQAAANYPAEGVTLSGAGKSWTLSPADLGLVLDLDKTLDAAMTVGRSGSALDNLGAQFHTLFGGAKITPVLKYDTGMVDKAVARIAAEVDRPAANSKLEQAADGTVQITASAVGTSVDREALRAELVGALSASPFGPVNVTTHNQLPTVTEAALKDSQQQAMLLSGQPIALKSGKQSWTLQPDDLRGMLVVSATNESGQWTVTLNKDALGAYLQPIGDELRVEARDAAVVIGKGTVTLKKDASGSDLDVSSAVEAIQQAALREDTSSRTVDLPIKVTEAKVHTSQVQALYDKANGLVSQGLRLYYKDDGYILRGSSVTGFIDVAPDAGGAAPYKLVIDEDVLSSRISGVAYNFNRPASDARFRMVNGTPTKVAAGREGLKVSVSNSLQNALKAIDAYTGGSRLQVDLDMAVTEPNLLDADVSTIQTPDLLGMGQTSYHGSSPERAWNVGMGTRNVDGALVPPGGVFSTVDTIGDLTLDAGFKMGYAIVHTDKGLTTVPAEAGGICQVSTTLFHSVFRAGLPIVERNWHSYWIALYGRPPSGLQGLDATIAPPEKDFRFKNTTGHWLLISATADGENVTFKLYGVNPGWNVSIGQPVITNIVKTTQDTITETSDKLPAGKKVMVEHAQDGFNSKITRVVTDASGSVIDKWTASSSYAPAHNRYLVGTGSAK